jgi:hypothetical protein
MFQKAFHPARKIFSPPLSNRSRMISVPKLQEKKHSDVEDASQSNIEILKLIFCIRAYQYVVIIALFQAIVNRNIA